MKKILIICICIAAFGVVALAGVYDEGNFSSFGRLFQPPPEGYVVAHIGPQTPSLLLDLRAVEWMSSAGVGTLMHLIARVQAHAGRMALWGCVPRVRAILRVCGLESPLNVCETEEEARQHQAELAHVLA